MFISDSSMSAYCMTEAAKLGRAAFGALSNFGLRCVVLMAAGVRGRKLRVRGNGAGRGRRAV